MICHDKRVSCECRFASGHVGRAASEEFSFYVNFSTKSCSRLGKSRSPSKSHDLLHYFAISEWTAFTTTWAKQFTFTIKRAVSMQTHLRFSFCLITSINTRRAVVATQSWIRDSIVDILTFPFDLTPNSNDVAERVWIPPNLHRLLR